MAEHFSPDQGIVEQFLDAMWMERGLSEIRSLRIVMI